MVHRLKIQSNYLENLLNGRKRVEIRFNDRDYQTGDILQFCDEKGIYDFCILHIHSGLGMADGYVALSVMNTNNQNSKV